MADDERLARYEATSTFLEERPECESALETVLEVDAERGTWTFDDVPVDSGTFGELVSRGIVSKDAGEYTVDDRESVRAALDGEEIAVADEQSPLESAITALSARSIDGRALAALVGALVVVALARMTAYTSVFRHHVISPGNDPYYFRYWLEQLLASSSGPTDYDVLVNPPHGVASRRPFSHAVNWWIAEILGGGQWAADVVAAWMPVLASVVLGAVVYALAVVLTRDVRVGLASVLVFAVTPVHAVYTGLGFLDHNAHQYLWLGVTLLTLAWLAVDLQRRLEAVGDRPDREAGTRHAVRAHLRSPLSWIAALGFGLSVAFGTHAWGGSPLLLIPLAGYIGLRTLADVRANVSPVLANLPVLAGLTLASALSIAVHVRWGWHAQFVSVTPALVLGGGGTALALGDLWRRLDVRLAGLFALEAVVAFAGLYGFRRLDPNSWLEARARVDDLLFREGISETVSLFSTEYAVFFGPLYQLGVGFYLALGVFGWVLWAVSRRYEPGWVLVGTYTGYLLVLAGIQVRFAAQLAIPLAVLAGLGVVYTLSAIDLARAPVPFRSEDDSALDRETRGRSRAVSDGGRLEPSIALPERRGLGYLVGIGLIVFGLSLLYVPGLTAEVAHGDAKVDALAVIEDDAAERGLEYPENYVLSEWGDSRLYNHFVNGESQGYGYAQRNYDEFQTDPDPDGWYEQFDGRVGYVVVTDVDATMPDESAHTQLLEDLGAGDGGEALSHYRLLSVDEDRSAAAFAVVPGATLTVAGSPNETVSVRTAIEVDAASFTYEAEGTVGDDGRLEVTVPYAGEYTVGDRRATVTEADVLNGTVVDLE